MIYKNPSTKHEDYLFQIIDQESLKDSKNNIVYVFFPLFELQRLNTCGYY